jgi:hypothetical protein
MSHMLMRMDSVKQMELVEDVLSAQEGKLKVQRKSVTEAAGNLAALQEEEAKQEEEEKEGLDLSWPEGLQNQVRHSTRSTMSAVGLNIGQDLRRRQKAKALLCAAA